MLYTTLITSYILKVALVVFKQRHCHVQDPQLPSIKKNTPGLPTVNPGFTLGREPRPRPQAMTALADEIVTSRDTAHIHGGTIQHHLQIRLLPARESAQRSTAPDL
jgi:hypothetical protein